MSGSFQTSTKNLQNPAFAGDFSSLNPYSSALSTQVYNSTGFRAGPLGLTIGLFAWLDPATFSLAGNSGSGAPQGFVGRAGRNALITTYLSAFGMTIPSGSPAGNIYISGDFWIVNNGSNVTSPGQKAYANNTSGVATFATSGLPTTGGSGSGSTIAAGTGSVTATIVDNVLTTSGSVTGSLPVGAILSGTGVAPGTYIAAQLTGTPGGAGTYSVSPRTQTVASTTVSATFGTLTIGGTVVSGLAVGQTVLSASTAAGTVVTALGSGTGGAGTYVVNLTQTVGSEAMTSVAADKNEFTLQIDQIPTLASADIWNVLV